MALPQESIAVQRVASASLHLPQTSGRPMPPNPRPDPLQDPQFLPFKLDVAGARVLFVRLDSQQRAEAAFLDERALPAAAEGYWVGIDAWLAAAATATATPRLDWIFHIGHCGSTLLSRLLQAWPGVAPLREPLPLRALAALDAGDAQRMRMMLRRLAQDWARPLPPATCTMIKATSSCNALAGDALRLHADSRALWLDMALEPWLATILKSPDSVGDVLAAASERARLLAGGDEGIADELRGLPPQRQCAMSWLAERVRCARLRAALPQRCLHVDFDDLLAQPEAELSAIAAHLGLDPARIAHALASPWWRRYSKAGEHAYAADDRVADLKLAHERFGDAIREAQVWLDGFLARHPHLAA